MQTRLSALPRHPFYHDNHTQTLAAYIQANTDGRLHDAAEPSLSPLNRGFLYGDSVYEVWRTYGGSLFAFDEHWERLQHSAGALQLEVPFEAGVLLTEIRRTVSAFFEETKEKKDVYVRLQLSRGGGPIGLDTALADHPAFVILVKYLAEEPKDLWTKGLSLTIGKSLHRNHPRTLNPAWKTGNYLNNVLCLREARSRGADDGLILNLDGEISEASTSNVFFVGKKEILTPPSSAGILEGVTRRILLEELGADLNHDLREETITPARLPEFSECFLTSTTRGITPVGSIDKIDYKVGAKTVTAQMRKKFETYVRNRTERRPELKIFDL